MLPVSSSFHANISLFPRNITAAITLSGVPITNFYSIDIIEELDPIGNNAPPKEATIVLTNAQYNPYVGSFQDKQVIVIAFNLLLPSGLYESVAMGTFYLYNWHNDDDYMTATLYARDLLGLMTQTDYTGIWAINGTNGMDLATLAADIIADFQLQQTNMGTGITVTSNIDPSLSSIYTRGLVPLTSHHDALMYVAQAANAVIWVDRNNVLQIKPSFANAPLNTMPYTGELTLAMQETYPKIAVQNPYNCFTANLSSYGEASSSSQVFSGTFPITGTATVWCPYNMSANGSSVSATITGGTFVSGVFYADGANISVSGGSGSVNIVLNGNQITSTTSQSVVNNASSGQPINNVDLTSNPLLTTSALVNNLLNWVAAECQGTYLYQSESWMDPSFECGDLIYWDSQYATGTQQARIIKQEFRFNGTLSGTINGKGLGGSFAAVLPASGDTSGGSSVSGSGGGGSPAETTTITYKSDGTGFDTLIDGTPDSWTWTKDGSSRITSLVSTSGRSVTVTY